MLTAILGSNVWGAIVPNLVWIGLNSKLAQLKATRWMASTIAVQICADLKALQQVKEQSMMKESSHSISDFKKELYGTDTVLRDKNEVSVVESEKEDQIAID